MRHLRRTRLVLHVVDAAAQDPGGDYWAVREELRMYNPEYCQRPHVVVLNKMDLEDASELQEEVAAEVRLGFSAGSVLGSRVERGGSRQDGPGERLRASGGGRRGGAQGFGQASRYSLGYRGVVHTEVEEPPRATYAATSLCSS